MSTFAARLKELRGTKSQASFSATIGINRVQYAKYESGVNSPSVDVLATICRVHACSADWLLGIEKTPPAVSVIGNGNAVAQGAGARAVATSKAQPGEMPQCAKCPIKKQLAKVGRIVSGK